MVLPDEVHQVQGAAEAALRGRPLLLAPGGISAQRHDVPHPVGLAVLEKPVKGGETGGAKGRKRGGFGRGVGETCFFCKTWGFGEGSW